MNRRTKGIEWLLLGVVACSAPKAENAQAPSVAQPGTQPARESAAEPLPSVAPTPALAWRALELADHGQPLGALRLLVLELGQRLAARPWSDSAYVTESFVSACVLEDLLESTHAWRAAVEGLERAQPFPPETPPELAAQLDLVLARGLLRVARVAEARALVRANGVLVDWRIIGPFANERGGGHDTQYPPEAAVDLSAAMPGKEREVTWRANPAPQQVLGNVVLEEMLRPNDQAVAYLATAIEVDTARDVALWLGTSGSFKLWHDGTLVHARKLQRPSHRDQERVLLALQPGWNRILLKVGVEERGAWGATARVTELDGRPLRDLACDSSHAGDATNPAAKSTAVAPPLVREILEARAEDAEQGRQLALYHLSIHPDDVADHTAKKHAERAVLQAPDDVMTRYLLARASAPEHGESTAEIRHNERLLPLKFVIEHDPRHVAALLDLAEFSMNENPLPERADELSARAIELAPGNARAVHVRCAVLEARSRDAESEVLFEAACDSDEGRLLPACILARAQRLGWHGDLDGELRLLTEATRAGSGEREVYGALIERRFEHGDVDGALAATDDWLERQPFDLRRLLASAQSVEYAGRTADARALVERALALCPDDAQVHFVLARLAQRDDDLARADAELARVIELDPGYDKARRQRDVLAAQKQAERFEEPYRWDALERLDGLEAVGANEQVQLVDRTTVWLVEPDGTEHEYEHLLLRLENSGGVKALDNYWIAYPDDASLQVYNVRVIHADKSFERAPAPRGGDGNWGGQRVRAFDLPPLVVGDCVEIEYRIDPTQPDVFGQYFGTRHLFGAQFPDPLAPVLRSELVVIAPAGLPIYAQEQNGERLERSRETDAQGRTVHRWIARDIARPTPQGAMPDVTEFAPLVDVSTFENWQAFAAWWWNFIEKEFVTTPAMKDKVAELTRGLTSEHDKVRAIARFVGQEIRYNAWAFGTHGYEPYSAATIFERRFGDCKDKSILLRQMLAEVGVEAHPVLINAEYRRPEEQLDIAMIGHFNHCIAYLPATAEREGYYLDATADRNPIEYIRADDQGAQVLHVRAGQGSLHQVPYWPASECALVREYEIALDREGGGEVRLADTSTGSFGVNLRYAFGGEQGDLAKRVADSLAKAFGKVDVLDVRTSDLEDIGAPARLDVRLHATGLWNRDASGANLRLTFDDIPILGVASESAEEREWDVVLDRPFEMRTTLVWGLPPDSKVASLPPDTTITAPGLLAYTLSARETARGVEVVRDFTLLERRIPKERYADFQSALREIQLAENRTIVLTDTTKPESGKDGK